MAGLLATTDFDVIVAARNRGRLAALVDRHAAGSERQGPARLTARVLDTGTATPDDLWKTGAFVVIDAAGPFQKAPMNLPTAAIAAGMHYVDLADARDFVAGFATLDTAAKAADVVAITGASSTPALSNAVLDKMTRGWRVVHSVDIAISPGNRAPRGLAVVRSILSYAGRPVTLFESGKGRSRPGWGLLARRPMPGLGRRWLSLAETPRSRHRPGPLRRHGLCPVPSRP